MNSTIRTALVAAGALVVGLGAGYAYSASLPLSVTSTDVATNAPAGEAALASARAGIVHLDKATADIGKETFDKAGDELAKAKAAFADVAKASTDGKQPVMVAQEAVIAHSFTPGKVLEATGSVGAAGFDAASMSLTRGSKTRPLALTDYSISFGDLNVDTDMATKQIDLAMAAVKDGKKAAASEAIMAARGAVTFSFNGDQIGEN